MWEKTNESLITSRPVQYKAVSLCGERMCVSEKLIRVFAVRCFK